MAFSSRARILREYSTLIPRLRFIIFFFKVEISSRTLIPLFWRESVHSGSASWDDCDRAFPDGLRVSSFPDRFQHYAWTAWLGSFTCHCGNTGVEQTPNKSQHTKLTLEKKIHPPLLPGFELATFRLRVRRSNQRAIPAAWQQCSLEKLHSCPSVSVSARKNFAVWSWGWLMLSPTAAQMIGSQIGMAVLNVHQ